MKYILPLLLSTGLMMSCGSGGQARNQSTSDSSQLEASVTSAPFDADSAYMYVKTQVEMGGRTPGSLGHRTCGDWIARQLKGYGFIVAEQKFPGKTYDGKPIEGRNIIASLKPEQSERLLLMAHWDTRAVADEDSESSQRSEPIDGADDGASGVAVLMELARQWSFSQPNVGIDLVFFDLEDGGHSGDNDSWCLGSQYWAKHPHQADYKAYGGILLDMVGARDARFHWESKSLAHAAPLLTELWDVAKSLGYISYFPQSEAGAITDDHVPVIDYLGIPCVDIINFSVEGERQGFGSHWHTKGDNMSVIDKTTLGIVGQTIATYVKQKHSK